jgi:hypothetical protein
MYHLNLFSHAITNGFEGWRRLGDNILTVCKTKYFAREYNLPYYFSTFPYFDSFHYSTIEKPLTDDLKNSFKKMIFVNSSKDITDNISSQEPILFVCVYLSATPSIYEYIKNNPSFEQEIHQTFTPYESIKQVSKPSDQLTIAVHVRKGGGFDWPLASNQEFSLDLPLLKNNEIFLYKKDVGMNCEDIWPLRCLPGLAFITETKYLAFKKTHYADYIWAIKFPPDQYYIEQIKTMISLLQVKTVKIQLFTDDPNPENIVIRYKKALANVSATITFDYRKSDNSHDKNVIQDLFAMIQCDGLISASSSFAFTAMILGNHSSIIYPEHAITMQDKVIIDRIKVIQVTNPKDITKRKVNSSVYSITVL